ncbi:MBL fold metallo-hydrolase [Thiothrix subterranea]|uniref:MBL fold metallo-hydrolase n=1 Tax=Thiothrix subterranea TaxID=2735563 RepID=UPI00280AA183|nr:MBL fold metallo-hydrolase [Thiothrix subterranea]
MADTPLNVSTWKEAVEFAPGVHWIGALDPTLRTFDIILKTANGTTYNSYLVRGSSGVAIIDTVKEGFEDEFFHRLESVARYDEIKVIVLNHLEPDHSGALPELMRRAPKHGCTFPREQLQCSKHCCAPTAKSHLNTPPSPPMTG